MLLTTKDKTKHGPPADRRLGVAKVAGARVPVFADAGDFDIGEGHGHSIAEEKGCGSGGAEELEESAVRGLVEIPW